MFGCFQDKDSMLDLDSSGFSGYGCLVWIWTFGCFQGYGSVLWIWTSLDFQDLDLFFWIWIRFFPQDIGVDRDTKMHKCAAVDPVFRAPVIFLRRLVISSRFLDF